MNFEYHTDDPRERITAESKRFEELCERVRRTAHENQQAVSAMLAEAKRLTDANT